MLPLTKVLLTINLPFINDSYYKVLPKCFSYQNELFTHPAVVFCAVYLGSINIYWTYILFFSCLDKQCNKVERVIGYVIAGKRR